MEMYDILVDRERSIFSSDCPHTIVVLFILVLSSGWKQNTFNRLQMGKVVFIFDII